MSSGNKQTVRVAAMSDLHGWLPRTTEMPEVDLLLIAGDIVPLDLQDDRAASCSWVAGEFAHWLDAVPAAEVVAVAGNHDFWALDVGPGAGTYHRLFGARWTYLQDAQVLTDSGLRVYGSPWTRADAGWAFEAPRSALRAVFSLIPDGVDVLITHSPPRGFGDRAARPAPATPRQRPYEYIGSSELLAAIERANPQLAVYGHVHEDGGYRHRHRATLLANVSVLDARYRVARGPGVFGLTPRE